MSDPNDLNPNRDDPALVLIREGWNHLKRQRPLAARASWLRALRIDPENKGAREALATLDQAAALPKVARVELKLRPPSTEPRRKRWDAAFRASDVSDPAAAARVFATLVEQDPLDPDAWYDNALGSAWMGSNVAAVAALDRFVELVAATDLKAAADAWTLAELLRQGGGAEQITDDLTYTLVFKGEAAVDPDFRRFLLNRPEIQGLRNPALPASREVHVWLDRPADEIRTRAPRILAYLTFLPDRIQVAGPDAFGLETIRETLESTLDAVAEREAAPVSINFIDAPVWSILIPPELPEESRSGLLRDAVEHYYEDLWINRPRFGLGGKTPLEAARAAATDPVTRAKLLGIVGFVEQVLERPVTIPEGRGYPVDRLRRRLGLPTVDPDAAGFDRDDVSCMGEAELDALRLQDLNETRLADACESVLPLGDDDRSARFAAALVGRGLKATARSDRRALFAVLVRDALRTEGIDGALSRLDQADEAERLLGGAHARVFRVWRAELLMRAGDADAAADVYLKICRTDPDDAVFPLEAAEALADRGYAEHAQVLAALARDRARTNGDFITARRAERLAGEDES